MAQETSITIHLKLKNEDKMVPCDYASVEAALACPDIKGLFDDNVVEKCIIKQQGKRLTGVPLMTWDRFKKALEPYRRKV